MVHMPTGEEPPKGFEKLYDERRSLPKAGALTIDYVSVSQLASMEKIEIEQLRQRAGKHYTEQTGKEPDSVEFEEALNFVPKGKTVSDKLIFRAYSGKYLAGYAQVICGWPNPDEWTIMALIVDPSFRNIGIGHHIIVAVEEAAKVATINTNHLYAIPTLVVAPNFWSNFGFDDEIDRFQWKIGSKTVDVLLLRKKL